MKMQTTHHENRSALARFRDKINVWDLLALIFFAGLSALYSYLRWRGVTPFVLLNSDAANIASFAAGRDFPALFVKDALLGNPDNFHYYSTVHIPLLRALAPVFGDYGTAFMALLPPHIFVQMLGFYVLGRCAFHDRFWAMLLVLITLRHIPTGIGADFWGLYGDAIPRITFQAAFPWVMAAAWRWRAQPRAWPWILVASGLLMYAHPVSAPALGFALWLGFWFFLPAQWSAGKRIAYMLLIGVVFLASTFPFTRNYVTNHSFGESFDYETIFKIMHFRFNTIFMDVPYAIRNSSMRLLESLLLPLAAASGVILWRIKGRARHGLVLCAAWAAGFAFVSMPLPLAEHEICRALKIIPLEIDLIRNVRFIYPVGLLLCLLAMRETWRAHPNPKMRSAALAAAIVGLAGWTMINRPPWMTNHHAALFKPVKPQPVRANAAQMIDALTFIKESTPEGSVFLPATNVNPLAIRYYSLRSVVLCAKDGGALAFTNHKRLVQWYDNFMIMQRIDQSADPEQRLLGYVELARDLDADYLFMDYGREYVLRIAPHLSSRISHGNEYFTIIRM